MKIFYGKSDLTNYSEFCVGFAYEDDLTIFLGKESEKKYEKFCKSKAFEGKFLQHIQLQEGEKCVMIIGLGKKNEFDTEWLRRGAITAYKMAEAAKVGKLEFVLPKTNINEKELAQALCEGAILAFHSLNTSAKYKSDDEKNKSEKKEIELIVCGKNEKEIKDGISIGKIFGNAQNYVRELCEMPANLMPPRVFAEEAKKLANQYKMKIEILEKNDLEKKGMNGLLSVGKGSANDPMMISIEYVGYGDSANITKNSITPFYSVVGKGIIFDSGGISLKPSKVMHEMKYDKTGACIVLGVLKAVAELKLPIRLLGVMPIAENLPSGTASKPGDIIKAYSGKTIEILNTDAEGRLILADALAYTVEKKPDIIIDVATLTGAIITSLGRHAIGLFSNDFELAEKIKNAGMKTYERVWSFPLWKEYSEMIKGDFADITNNGNETGGASSIIAAMFLKEFVNEISWAHLDIAGVYNVVGKHALIEKGATGTGTRLIVQTLINCLQQANQKI